jgi:SAM-dependent methyltransferase
VGTAAVQGELWGSRARVWADLQEPSWRPAFNKALDLAGVRAGARLLDIGCGAGGALLLARGRGAEVAGLDASENLAAIARERLPGARIETGEMEELPFKDGSFDIVIGINSFQFAGDLVRALAEARRVCRRGGAVFMMMWGRAENCELFSITMAPVLALLPAPPPSAPTSLGEPGIAEDFMRKAGLEPADSGEFAADLVFPDEETAVRAITSAAPTVRACREVGEDLVIETIRKTLPRVLRQDGSVGWSNRFRWVKAARA